MKKQIIALVSFALLFVFTSCDNAEISLAKGSVAFTFSAREENNPGGRLSQTPAFILLSIEDDHGNELIKDRRVEVVPFGQKYTTANLELATGTYNLTKFMVLDSSNHTIYATPLENSALASYVNDPLPIPFSIAKNSNTRIIPQVLVVEEADTPASFGYVSFDFEVIERPDTIRLVDLLVRLQIGESNYDSVFISFSDSATVRKQRLILNPITHIASGIVTDLQTGNWKISISYFQTIVHNSESEVKIGSATVSINAASETLFSTGSNLFINDSNNLPEEKIISWGSFYVFYFFGDHKLDATVALPADPLNSFFEITLFNPHWDYFYADRTFYNAKADEPGSHYLQGSAALESYNSNRTAIDYIDTVSFKKVTEEMKLKAWNIADCVVLFYIGLQEQPLFMYYEWDFRNPSGGRKPSVGMHFSREQFDKRRRANLK